MLGIGRGVCAPLPDAWAARSSASWTWSTVRTGRVRARFARRASATVPRSPSRPSRRGATPPPTPGPRRPPPAGRRPRPPRPAPRRAGGRLRGHAYLDPLKIRVELALGQVDDAGDVGLRGGAEEIGQAGGHLQARGGALNGRVGLSQHLILHPAPRPPATTATTAA